MDETVIAKSGSSQKLDGDLDGRFVKQDEFFDHLNHTVFTPILGVEIKRQVVKDIVTGIANQIVILVLSGARVRIGRLGTFFAHVMPAGSKFNPKTRSMFEVPERRKLSFKASNSTRKTFGFVDSDS